MRNKYWTCLALLIVIPGFLFAVSCAQRKINSAASVSEVSNTEMAQDTSAVDKKTEMKADTDRQQHRQIEIAKKMEETHKNVFPTELVLFDFDSSVLTTTAQERLAQKAKWLKQNPNVSVVIEGHCDERGSTEYNLALGERRSETAKTFLVNMGISASRLTSVSYGEERPFMNGHNEDAWSMNRRAHFVIK